MDPYSYTPLDAATNEIRLIRLLPGLPPRRIEVEVFHVPLSAEEEGHAGPVYEAVSYVWGSTSNPQFIAVRDALKGQQKKRGRVRTRIHRFKFALSLCGDPWSSNRSTNEVPAWRTLSVTHNLAIASEHLRRPTESRIFWIDAICINQDDRAERSAQVCRMGTIYSIASQVVVWLGPQYENSTLAVQTLRYIGESWKLDSNGFALNWTDNREGNGQAEEDERRRVLLENDVDALEATHLSWIAIRDLLRRQWFSRLWVFQEIRKATQAILVVGHTELPWDMFQSAFYWIYSRRVEANPISKIMDLSDCSRVEPFVDITAWSNVGIAYLTNEAMTELSCSDPRDRVYALLSLFDPKDTMEISPDYSLSVEDVYTDFFFSVLHRSLQLYLLQLCGFSHGPSQLHLPSWAPDFSARRPQVINFSAPAGQSEHEAARIDAATLRIRGVLGDTIEHVTEPVPLTATTSEIAAICKNWLSPSAEGDLYLNGDTMLEAFVVSLVCGRISELIHTDFGEFPSLEDYCNFYAAHILGEVEGTDAAFPPEFLRTLPGRAFFHTLSGHIGLYPEGARPRDQICVVLGVNAPLLLRSIPGKDSHCQLVGECYVHGLMFGEDLLGPLPSGWRLRVCFVDGRAGVLYLHEGSATQEDPRLGDLPPDWCMRYWNGGDADRYDLEYDENGKLRYRWFVRVSSGESTKCDPRLTSEALKARGVDIRDFLLV